MRRGSTFWGLFPSALGLSAALLSAVAFGMTLGIVMSVLWIGRDADTAPLEAIDVGCQDRGLTVATAPDMAPVLAELVPPFAADQEGIDDRCLQVEIEPVDSAELARRLASDDLQAGALPNVWIPDSSVWVRYVEAGGDGRRLIPDETPSIARSPTIGAMLQPMAEALGWPGRQLGWAEVLPLIQDRDIWSDRGHPGWGTFQMGFTNPLRSTVGLHSILSLGAAQDGVWIDELSSEGLGAPSVRLPLLHIERGVARRHDTTMEQLTDVRAADDRGDVLSFMSALPISERDLWRYNQGMIQTGSSEGAPRVPFVGIYPREGGLHFDYPYVELVGSDADDGTRMIAREFSEYLQSGDAQRRLRENGFRDRNNIPGAVLERAEGLQPERAGGMAPPPSGSLVRAALDAWETVSRRSNTLVVIDVSGSMQLPAPGGQVTRLERTIEAATGAIELSATDSAVGLWEFSTGLPGGDGAGDRRELVPLGPVDEEIGDTPRRERLIQELQQLAPANDTALYDTILAAVRAVRDAYEKDRLNDVVILTDGRSDGDDLDLDGLVSRLRSERDERRPVRVLAIAYGDDADVAALRRVAKVTDGKIFTPQSSTDMPAVFLEVLTGS